MSTAMGARHMRLRCNICRRYLKSANVKIMFCDRCEGSFEVCDVDWGRHNAWAQRVVEANRATYKMMMWDLFDTYLCNSCIEEALA